MIYAASQFKNELDVLEIRLGTIADQVDRVVLAEATVDQRGRPRDLVFPAHQERFAEWADKIEYVIVDDMPQGATHEDDVARERHQRDALIRGMPDLGPRDSVYVSDLDEIPYPDALADGLENPRMRFPMDLFVYRLNWRWLERGCRIGTLGAVVQGRDIQRLGVCGAVLWDSRVQSRGELSGWHLTYQGDVETLRSKMTGMMDKVADLVYQVDPETVLTSEWIQGSIDTGRDIYGRVYRPTEWVDLDQLPPYVAQHRDRFEHMTVPQPSDLFLGPRCNCGGIFLEQELAHFQYCALSALPDTLIHQVDMRGRPRAYDV